MREPTLAQLRLAVARLGAASEAEPVEALGLLELARSALETALGHARVEAAAALARHQVERAQAAADEGERRALQRWPPKRDNGS